jgi:hypothetical protein
MQQIVHADIFFFITTIVVVLLAALLAVLLVFAIKIFHDIRRITGLGRRKAEQLSEDLDAVREHIKREGMNFSDVLGFFKKSVNWFGRIKKTSKNKNEHKK